MAIDNAAISNIVREVVERQLGSSQQSPPANCDLPNAATLKEKFRQDQPTSARSKPVLYPNGRLLSAAPDDRRFFP